MKSLILVIIFGISLKGFRIAGAETKDEYLMKRDAFILEEKSQMVGGKITLTVDEEKVNSYLMKLKSSVIQQSLDNGTIFPPAVHFFQAKSTIESSDIFKLIRRMPKGAALHAHDSAIVDIHWLVKRATYDSNCYMCVDTSGQLKFHFFPEKPSNSSGCAWKQVIQARQQSGDAAKFDERLYAAMTMTVDDPVRSYPTQDAAWRRFLSLFAAINGLYLYAPVFRDFCTQALTEFYTDNVQYVEIRALLPITYDLDGKEHDSDWAMETFNSCFKEFNKDHSDFSGAKIILSSIRSLDKKNISVEIQKVLRYLVKYPDVFAGYDLVSQEDHGHSLLYFLDELLAARHSNSDLKYFFHAGETGWEGLSVDENLIDAVLLNTTRIGHGFAASKHPKVLEKIKVKDIAIEINPISNQVLKLVDDLRDHPATVLLANDFPLVISSDDPALWGASGLSYDYYEAFMGLGGAWADLKTLKGLAINSIKYSAMSQEDKVKAMTLWRQKWSQFIEESLRLYRLR